MEGDCEIVEWNSVWSFMRRFGFRVRVRNIGIGIWGNKKNSVS